MDTSASGAGATPPAGTQPATHDRLATPDQSPDILGLEPVIRAFRAIAAQTRSDRLAATVARVLLEVSGAQRASLLTVEGDEWARVATAETGGGHDRPHAPGETSDDDLVPDTVLQAVRNSLEPVVLDGSGRARSVLWVPLVSRGHLLGVARLSSDAPRAFAPDLVPLVELVAGRAAVSIDTARRVADLETSEAQARRIISTADEGIVVLAADGQTITFVNARMAGMLGFAEGELVARHFADLFADTAEAQDHARRIETRRQGLAEHYERRFRRSDGTDLWTLASATPILLDDGAYGGSFGMFTDITERKHAEQELALVSHALDQVGEAAFLIGEDGRFRLVNNEACRALGLDRRELLSMAVWDIDPTVTEPTWPAQWALVRDERSLRFSSEHRSSDGRAFPVEISASYFEFGGRSHILALARDTTDRQRTEATIQRLNADLEATIAAIPDLLFEIDRDGTYLAIHARSPELLVAPPEQLLGRTLAEMLPSDAGATLMEGIRDAEEHGASYGRVVRLDLPGGPRYFEQSIARKPTAEGGDARFVALSRDVTERVVATEALERGAEALRASEERYRLVFDNVRESLYLLEVTEDGHFRNLEVNPALVASAGLTREQMVGRLLEEALSPETAAMLNEEYAACVASGRTVEKRRVVTLPSGVRVYDTTLIPVRNREGRIDRLVGISHDVTEREAAEEAQRATELKYQTLLEQASEAIFVNDADRRYTDVNIAACELLGYEREELLALSVGDVTPPDVNPGQEERFRRMMSGEVVVSERVVRRKDGVLVPVELSTRRLADGRFVAMGRDVSERRRAAAEQARLVAAVEQAAEAVVITDPDGSIRYVNPAYEQLSGYPREELLGQNPRILKSGQHDAAFFRAMWDELLAGRTWRGTVVNRRKDGSLVEEDSSISPIHDGAGELLGYAGVQRDVTRERALEGQLRQAQKMEAVGQLAGGIAHDFNNLITAIRGYAELLRDSLREEHGAREDLDQIVLAADRAAELTRQLLAFSRRLPLEPRIVAPAEVIERLAPMLRRLLGEHIELVTHAGPEPGRVLVDPSQLEQVIVNLAVNARDAMPHGGRLVIETADVELHDAVAGHPELHPGRYVTTRVADTGAGMSAEVRGHAFEPFFTTKEAGKGTGMGLATVYGIVTASGGSVSVYSEPGRGTTFRVYLPAIDDATAAAREPAAPPELLAGSATILLVEDEPGVRSFARRALEDLGYTVLEAANGVEALDVAAKHGEGIDLVVSDVVMPHLGGIGLTERLRAARPDLRVLLVSGFADDHDGAREIGIDQPFLAKPFSREALGRAVRQVLGSTP